MVLALFQLVACGNKKETSPNPTQGSGQNLTVRTASGTVDGGGGKGVVCTDPKTGSKKYELLDLYEGSLLYGFNPRDFGNMSELEVLSEVMKKTFRIFNESSFLSYQGGDSIRYEKDLKESLEEIKNSKGLVDYFSRVGKASITFVDEDTTLKDTNDSLEPMVNKNCEVIQIAVYYDEAVLLIKKDYWEKLTPRSRVALFMHEIFYKGARDEGEKNSKKVRKFVSSMMADNVEVKPVESRPGDKNDEYLGCYIMNSESSGIHGRFIIYEEKVVEDGETRNATQILFTDFAPYTGLFRRTAEIYHSFSGLLEFSRAYFKTPQNSTQSNTPIQTNSARIEDFSEDLNKGLIRLTPLTLQFNSNGIHKILNYEISGSKTVDLTFTCESFKDMLELEAKRKSNSPVKDSSTSPQTTSEGTK